MAPLLSIIILVYNRRAALERTVAEVIAALERLARSQATTDWHSLAEIIIVDNASTDGSTTDFDARFPNCRVIRLDHNLGVAAFNRGADAATGTYLLILDDDAWPAESKAIDHPPHVAARGDGGREGWGEIQPPATTQPASPTPPARPATPIPAGITPGTGQSSLVEALAYLDSHPAVAAVMLQPVHPRTGSLEWPFDRVPALTTNWPDLRCANLVRRDAWNAVGGYEEHFFLYRNDTDLALKLLGSGRDIAYNPAWRAMHDSPHIAVRRVRWFFLSTRNWCWMCRRHARYRHALAPMLMGWLWAHRLARWSPPRHWAALSGALAGLFRPAPKAPPCVARDGRALRRLIALKRSLRNGSPERKLGR